MLVRKVLVTNNFIRSTKSLIYLNISVVAPSSENSTAGGENRSLAAHSSAPTYSLFSPKRSDPPSHLKFVYFKYGFQMLPLTVDTNTNFFILSLNLPADTSRYTCNSTRWPGAGLSTYLHTVGPTKVVDCNFKLGLDSSNSTIGPFLTVTALQWRNQFLCFYCLKTASILFSHSLSC